MTRPDRDKYVRINWKNLEGDTSQFRINKNAFTKRPYDYESIMHYRIFQAGNNEKTATITPINCKGQCPRELG